MGPKGHVPYLYQIVKPPNHQTSFPKDITNSFKKSPNLDITNPKNFPPAELIP